MQESTGAAQAVVRICDVVGSECRAVKNALESRRRKERGWQVVKADWGGGEAKLAVRKFGQAVLVKLLSRLVSKGVGKLVVVVAEMVVVVKRRSGR